MGSNPIPAIQTLAGQSFMAGLLAFWFTPEVKIKRDLPGQEWRSTTSGFMNAQTAGVATPIQR
jgi:hypothetical protein